MTKIDRNFWLMKTEPEVFSFEDLLGSANKTANWDGVRNYQARNFMRDQFRIGDGVLVYHSRVEPPAIVGLAEVAGSAVLDPSALDQASKYYDVLSAKRGVSQWCMAPIRATHRLTMPLSLPAIKEHAELASMLVIKKGMRLSIQPVKESEWDFIRSITGPKDV
jgi:predicted RNA-binding protein with PUA-like domain